jgi:hypothetical protein
MFINDRHYTDKDFILRKFELLEDQIHIWTEEFRINRFEVVLLHHQREGSNHSNDKTIVDASKAKEFVLGWREEWKRTGITPRNIKIRPV